MKVPTGFKNNEVTLEEFVKFLQAKAKETGRKFRNCLKIICNS